MNIKIHILYIGIILFIITGGIFGCDKMNEANKESEEKIIRSEEKIKIYEQNAKNQAHITDSIKEVNTSMKAVIEYQKNNPKIIETKYETILNGVLRLPTDDKIRYFARRVS